MKNRLKQRNQHANHLRKNFCKVEPKEFRKKMKERYCEMLSLAEYQYYWIVLDKEAMKKIGSKEIIKELEKTLAIRERIFQMCLANEIINPLLHKNAFEEVIGRSDYRYYQIDTAILRDEKNVVKFANEHVAREKWETCSENIPGVSLTVAVRNSQPVSRSTAMLNKDKQL